MAHSTLSLPPRYQIQLGARGRVVLPAEVREKLGLRTGDKLVLTVKPDGTIRLVSLREQLKKAQGMFRKHPERILSEELIRERRREAASEDE